MKDEKTTSDFLMFNGISKLINNYNDLDSDEVEYLKYLINNYVEKSSYQEECLLKKIDILKDMKETE